MFIVQNPPVYPYYHISPVFAKKNMPIKGSPAVLVCTTGLPAHYTGFFTRSHDVCTVYFLFLPSAEKTPAQIPNTAINAMIPIIQPCVIVIASISISPFNLLFLPL